MDITQIDILTRDLLFINYAVPPERVRAHVPEELALDTRMSNGRAVAFVSAVALSNADIHSHTLPLPRLSFEQINYRTYVNIGEGPGIYFIAIKVNSRLVAGSSSILRLPIDYESIEISTAHVGDSAGPKVSGVRVNDPNPYSMRCSVNSDGKEGLTAEVTIGGQHASIGPEGEDVEPDFIVDRPVGYVKGTVGGIWKIAVEHEKPDALSAHVENVRARYFESLGILNSDESMRPHSVLYVRELLFKTNPPTMWNVSG